ncbi:branched-chain amino acid ABC transporter permease [Roseivivax sp.]
MINGNLKASYAADERILDNAYRRGFVFGAAALAAALPFVANDYIILVAAQMGIMLIAVIGLNVVIGYTGLLSLGHAAFIAIGAYAVPLLHRLFAAWGLPEGVMPLLAIPLAVAVSALVGLVVGLPSLRVKGLYLAVATLSANFIVIFLIELDAMAPFTGGFNGINTPEANILGWRLDSQREMFALIAGLGFATILLVQNLFRTRVGRAFIAIRERDYSAEVLGISLLRYKLLSFAVSAACCGLAGALFAYFYARILPEQFELALSLQLVAALIVGGMGRTMGPVFGVVIIVMVPELLKYSFGAIAGGSADVAALRAPVQEIVFGALIILFLMFEPLGIAQIVDRWLRSLNRWPFARG